MVAILLGRIRLKLNQQSIIRNAVNLFSAFTAGIKKSLTLNRRSNGVLAAPPINWIVLWGRGVSWLATPPYFVINSHKI